MIDSMGTDHNPTIGIMQSHARESGFATLHAMSMKTVLAANLKALMTKRPDLDTLTKITAATDGALSNGKLDRVRRAAVATDIDTVERLAQVFGVSPSELLEEGAARVPLSAASTTTLEDAMRVIAASVSKVSDEDTRVALARMFSLLVNEPARAATTSQSIALLLSGAAQSAVPPETRSPKAADIQEADFDFDEDDEHGPGDRIQEDKRRNTGGG
jgi:hypothetical protein